MCELCSVSKEECIKAMSYRAEQLRSLARDFENIGSGYIGLHDDESTYVATKARNIIRFLVEDWL